MCDNIVKLSIINNFLMCLKPVNLYNQYIEKK